MTLLVDVNRLGSQENLVSNWSLLTVCKRMLCLGPRWPLAFWLWLFPTCLSASSKGMGCSAASWLRAFHGKVLSLSLSLFFFLSLSLSLEIPQFGLLSHISSFRLSSGHSVLVLTLRMQPMTPLLAGGRHEHLGYFSTWSCG